ncbi:AAA family ATPase [Oscillatoria sp. CS-180]|uniref:ParA family protein n=1 Tax=Oscillatoria sp. CS-180 TaxID=3021720 RepID=UPI0023300F28|nr:AAA family ATPase [Oscillatoria sp. CS-180]MDB9527046.1 AAA family ATPase [Oscillatoria sp. CS-180]
MQLEQTLANIPADAAEAIVESNFSKPFLNALGFQDLEIIPQFPVTRGAVDHAARKNVENDIFLQTHKSPYLYMEVKGCTEDLSSELCSSHIKAALQLKRYLLDAKSKTVKWGILTNSRYVQLFRKHNKIVHPVTACLSLDGNLKDIVRDLRKKIESPEKALTVAVYNNKGGVGKTTTTLNLAAILSVLKKRVLIVDFDPNQSDLGDALDLAPLNGKLVSALKNKEVDAREIITPYSFEHPRLKHPLGFDVILADEELVSDLDEVKLKQQIKISALHRLLESVKSSYDYILIDAPPNWRIFAQKALYAADVVLIPARHDNLHSLQNAGMAISRFLPEVRTERQRAGEYGPIPLPILMNNAFKVSEAQLQLMHQAIAEIIKNTRKNSDGLDLTPYFYPRLRRGHKDLRTNRIPYMAYISKADFLHVPAVFAFKTAREQYLKLAKEYFI